MTCELPGKTCPVKQDAYVRQKSDAKGEGLMRDKVIQCITARFRSFADLAEELTEDILKQSIPVPKHKTLKDHYWCIVGARESYTNALEAGLWSGFDCSLQTINTTEVIEKLSASAAAFEKTVNSIQDWTSDRDDLLTSLLEHEAMHEGQMIRHMYALNHPLPESWRWA
jgi:hypothetical protein